MSARKATKLGCFVWAIGTLFYTFEMLIKSSVSALSGMFINGFSLTAGELGWIGSSFYLAYVIMQIPAGLLSDKLGVRLSLILATFLCALGTLLFAYAHSFSFFIISRVIMGCGGAFAFISAMKLASMWFPPRLFPFIAGLTQLLGYMGGALAGTPLSALVNNAAWDKVFIGLSIGGFVIFVLVMVFVQAAHIAKPMAQNKPSFSATIKQLGQLCTNSQVLLNGIFCATTVGVAFALADLWGKQYLVTAYGISENLAAFTITTLVFFGIAISSPVWGIIATAIDKDKTLLSIGAAIGITATIVIIYIPVPLWILYICGFTVGVAQASHVLNFDIVKKIVDEHFIGTAIALLNMFGIAGAAILQIVIGMIMDGLKGDNTLSISDYKITLTIIPILFGVALLSAIFLKEKTGHPNAIDNDQL